VQRGDANTLTGLASDRFGSPIPLLVLRIYYHWLEELPCRACLPEYSPWRDHCSPTA
jgi:hypothetical protein